MDQIILLFRVPYFSVFIQTNLFEGLYCPNYMILPNRHQPFNGDGEKSVASQFLSQKGPLSNPIQYSFITCLCPEDMPFHHLTAREFHVVYRRLR